MKQSWRRPRLTVGALMLLIAVIALWFAWASEQNRSVIVVDLAAPDRITVRDRSHTFESLERFVRRSRFKQAVIRCDFNVPANTVLSAVKIIEASGVKRFQITSGLKD